jgi:cobalt-zinc-cadmium efflux system membrane fusion protein
VRIPGDRVKKGDALAEIESAELGKAQSAALSARAHAQAAIANEKRERHLADAKVSSERDAELARANALAARADLHAAEQAVRALGGGGVGAEMGILVLRSPIDGKVVESDTFVGQMLEPSHTAFRVADLSRLWVELAVFEREIGAIHPGDQVELSPQTERSSTQRGKVAYVGDVIDVTARSAPVRVEVDNADGKLRPGQSVVARIQAAAPASRVLNVPLSAVTRVDGVPTLFVALSDTSVETRAAELGVSDGTRIQVLSGLKPGEMVVVEGVFALKSELFR